LLWQSYDDLFLLWCHLFTVRCHFLTDDILTELQGIKFLLEQFRVVWTLKDTKNIQFVRKLRFHLSTERTENDFVDQNWCGTRRLLKNLLIVLLFLPVISAIV
jgi:hypothetical protein